VSTGVQIQLFAVSARSSVGWRLLSGNNREAGRGAVLYADAESCRIAVKELQRDVALLERRIRRTDANRWAWELHLNHVPVVVAARASDRLVRCEQSAAQIVVALASAPISTLVVYTASRRWGSVAS
jgi:hypothetical protein